MSSGLQASEVVALDDPEAIRRGGRELVKAGRAVHRTAATVHADWLQLVWCYEAPEQKQVWDAMRPPAHEAVTLSDDLLEVNTALVRYADELTELHVRRTALIADILTLNGEIADMRAEDEKNRWYNNVADWASQEDITLWEAEERLLQRMADLRTAKELAEIDCGRAIGYLWSAPAYNLADRGDVNNPHKYGASAKAYVDAVGTSDAPWSGPSLRMDSDWPTKISQLDRGALNTVVDTAVSVGDLAGFNDEGKTEYARRSVEQSLTDVWVVSEPFITRTGPDESYGESLVRVNDGALGAVGYGTWRANGWQTAGGFAPGLVGGAFTGGVAAPALIATRGTKAAASHHTLPPGLRLHPSLVLPAIQLRSSQAFTTTKTRLNAAIDTSLNNLDGAFGTPALSVSVPPVRATIVQGPPRSLSTLQNEAGPASSSSRGSAALPAATGTASHQASDIDVPELAWTASYDQQQLEADHRPAVIDATLPLLDKAREAEPQVTSNFLNALPDTARPHGLEHRIKSPEPIATKIERKAAGRLPTAVADQMADVLRYTSVTQTSAELIPSAKAIVAEMEKKGWNVISAQHSYVSHNPYKGIHCTMRSNELGVSVELQFHTEKSQRVKTETHGLYEVARHPDTSPADQTKADAELRIASDVIGHPAGLKDFQTLGGINVREITYASDRK